MHITNLRVQQLVVRHDDLLAIDGPDTRGFQPDRFDLAHRIAKADQFANTERAVEQDRQRCKQILEDALGRETNRDPADAKPCNKPGDVDAKVGQDEDRRDRKHRRSDKQADYGESAAKRIMPAGTMFDPTEDEFAGKYRSLPYIGKVEV